MLYLYISDTTRRERLEEVFCKVEGLGLLFLGTGIRVQTHFLSPIGSFIEEPTIFPESLKHIRELLVRGTGKS